MLDMDICFRTIEQDNGAGGRFQTRVVSAELDGIGHTSVVDANVRLSAGPLMVTVCFLVRGRPEFIAVGEDREPLEGWDPNRVEIPVGLDLNWQTIVEVAEDPISWHEMFNGTEPEETNLRIGMSPFPSAAEPIRSLQRIVWIELDGQRFEDFMGLRIDSPLSDDAPWQPGPVKARNGNGDIVEAYFFVHVDLLGAVSIKEGVRAE